MASRTVRTTLEILTAMLGSDESFAAIEAQEENGKASIRRGKATLYAKPHPFGVLYVEGDAAFVESFDADEDAPKAAPAVDPHAVASVLFNLDALMSMMREAIPVVSEAAKPSTIVRARKVA